MKKLFNKSIKRILCLLIILSVTLTFVSVSAQTDTEKRLEIDDFRDITTANVERILSTESYKITSVNPETLRIPDTIPSALTSKLEKLLNDAEHVGLFNNNL